jgi:hypothetical protein
MARVRRGGSGTYRGFRIDLGQEPDGAWSVVIHPPMGQPGRIETLRDSGPDALMRLNEAAQALVDTMLDPAALVRMEPAECD